MLISLARNQGDEHTFQMLIISKALRFAGDMTVLNSLSKRPENKGDNS